MRKLNWYLAGIALASLTSSFVGCGGSPAESASSPTAAAQSTSGTNSGNAVSEPRIVSGAESEAAQCVAVFLDSLRRGDEKAANGVLTIKAREELAKSDYAIQPIGTPQGKYTIGRIGFPYEGVDDVALVECTWDEPGDTQTPAIAMEIVCEVHREEAGWRISGMGVSMVGSDEALVLDFENAQSLESAIRTATEAPAAGGEQTASSTTGPSMQNPALPNNTGFEGLPPLPSGFNANAGADPMNNAPVNR